MIAISTDSFDLAGSFIIRARDARIRLGSISRRGSKIATLDGGVSIYDTGLSHGDREFEVQLLSPSASFIGRIKYLMEYHSSYKLSTREGVFTALLSALNEAENSTSFTISLEAKVA
jgi:hypothetical protein